MAVEITTSNFEEVLNTDKPVMIDFWAAWCGPCRMIAPLVDELAEEYKDRAVIAKVDVDSNQEIAMKYGVRNIPTVLFLKNGEVVDKSVGAVPKNVLSDKIDAHILVK
ncbi:MAG: thioredoxin [Bacteroidetes bacterium]|nr:thioredoxin [Bacteroidota bacterium]MDA0973724.1 thioredoxin [Bacteroidota bacterium]